MTLSSLTTPELLAELTRRGVTYSGLANLSSWSESPKGMFASFALEQLHDDELILPNHPFRGCLTGAKEGQTFYLVAVMTTNSAPSPHQDGGAPAGANGLRTSPSHEGDGGEGNDPLPGRQPGDEKRKWGELSYAQRAGIRCSEPTFYEFLKRDYLPYHDQAIADFPDAPIDDIAAIVVRTACNVSSRAHIKPGTNAAEAFDKLEAQYRMFLKYDEGAPA